MAADLARIKRNVAKMAGQGAPEADIDGYIASEGVTVDDVRNFKMPAATAPVAEALSPSSLKDKLMEGYVPINKEAPFQGLGDASDAFQAGAMQGMTLGFGDEINAGLQTPLRMIGDLLSGRGVDAGRSFGEGMQNSGEFYKERRDRNPIGAAVGDLLGSLVTGGGMAKGGLTLMNGAKSLPGMIGRGAAEGAAYGGASGFGRSEGDNVSDRGTDALIGALTGAGIGAGAGGVAGAMMARNAKASIPTVDELKGQARALYDKAEASGVTFPKAEVKTVADEITANAISDGIDPNLHPRATAALKRLVESADTGMTVKNAQTMRRVLAAASKDPMNPDEARIAGRMIDKFDDMVASKSPDLATARGIYHQAKKGELIEQAIELAKIRAGQYSNGGMENALRTEFRALSRKIAKGQLRGLSQEEIAAIKKVAEGGVLENALRFVGKAAPTGVVSAGLGTGVPFAIGNAVGGPGGGALAAGTVMGAGLLGKAGAEAMTNANALAAALLSRSGGKSVPKLLSSAAQRALAEALLSSGANESQAIPRRLPIELTIAGGNPALAQQRR